MKPKAAKNTLRKSIHELNNCRQHFTKNPKKDFTRNRKLSFEKMIQAILCMRDGSISNEMMDIFGFREDLATTSAFVQQRAKILPEAFELLFERFTKRASETKTYKGFQTSRFDFLPKQSKKHDPIVFYQIQFRIVRFPISENSFETVITNLDADLFPATELKKLYAMRWGIETAFRELKHTVGLQHFHSKKAEFVHQEIFARLTMYNFSELITQSVVIQQKNRKYAYKVNFTAAVHVCRQFFLRALAPPCIEAMLTRYISPVRPGRSIPRDLKPKQPCSFII